MKNCLNNSWFCFLLSFVVFSCTNKTPYSFKANQVTARKEVPLEYNVKLVASLDSVVSSGIKRIKQEPFARKHPIAEVVPKEEKVKPELPIKLPPTIHKKLNQDHKKREPQDKDTVFQFLRILVLLYIIAALIIAVFINFWIGFFMLPILIFLLPFISYLLYGEFSLVIIFFLILGDGKIGG